MKNFKHSIGITIMLIISIFIPSCYDNPSEPAASGQYSMDPFSNVKLSKLSLTEDYEGGSKSSYAVGDVTFFSGVWTLDDALVGTTSSDVKNGLKSVRTRNSGKITMKYNLADGASTVSIKHAKYGSDGNSTWGLWYSTNSGSSWNQAGANVTTSTTTLQTAEFTINVTGNIRFEIRKADGSANRINFDDFSVNDYVVASASLMENYEAGSKTSYAIGDVTFSSGVWTLNEALIGTSSSDRKTGSKSVRVRNSGIVTMKFNVSNGAGEVKVLHAKYGTDGNSTWSLWYSTNSGSSWTQSGSSVTTTSTTLQTASFTVNVSGSIRFEIRKTDGTSARVNFDEFTIFGYSGGGGGTVTEIEPNNSTSTANSILIPSTNTGYLELTSDLDYFTFSANSNQVISSGLMVPSGLDYNLYLLNSSGQTIASSTNPAGVAESITYNTTNTSVYYILVSSTSGSSTTLNYTMTANVTSVVTSVHLTMGNPSGAVFDVAFPLNYLMEKHQFVLSYNRDNGIPNWTAWHLNNTWIGSTPRQDDFRNDTSLPSGWYQVMSTSYSGSGYDRGHMCPSADRTLTVSDNSATFLMTNMIPQAPNNNQGPWASMENYLRTLISQGKEMYIYSGGYGSQGTIDNGRVNIPLRTWKIVVVIDEGNDDLNRVTTTTRVIAVDMPNDNALISRTADWKTFRVSADYVESKTGYDFLSNVPVSIQAVIESIVDNQ